MSKRVRCLSLAMSLVVLALWAGTHSAQSPAQTAVNSAPLRISADEIATWKEGSQTAYAVQGNVTISQGDTFVTMARGVVWVDVRDLPDGKAYFVDVYADAGMIVVQGGAKDEGKTGASGVFAFTTRGRIDIQPAGKVVEQDLSKDPIYLRAKDARPRIEPLRASATGVNPIRQVQEIVPPPGDIPGAPGPTIPPGPSAPPPPPPFFGAKPPSPPMVPPPSAGAPIPGAERQFSIRPRTSEEIRFKSYPGNGETIYVVPSPVIVTITNPKDKLGVLDIEADRLVFWTKGDGKKLFENMRGPQGETTQHIELYLSGNVELRSQTKEGTQILRADEVYYDVSRSAALAIRGNLEVKQPKMLYPIHFKSDELLQLNSKIFLAKHAEIYSTVLPSDPGLKISIQEATIEEREIPSTTIFGTPILDPNTGEPKTTKETYLRGNNSFFYFENVPFFYIPYLAGDVNDPLGPLDNLSVGQSTNFGFKLQTTWNLYSLFGLTPIEGTRWRLYLDYFSEKGPAIGTEFTARGKDLFGISNKYDGLFKAYGIYDTGKDVLGALRGESVLFPDGTRIPITHPDWRGRVLANANVTDLPGGFTVQGQIAALSDKNFLEQYYLGDFLNELNQETFLYVKQQNNQWAWSVLAEPGLRNWVTETQWLPKADGWLLGQKVFEYFTWNVHGSAGYGLLRPTQSPHLAYAATDARTDAGRFDLWSDLSLPFNVGPVKLVPYLTGDGTYYTDTIPGGDTGRLLGGAGLRASIPFSRLYCDVRSEFFNLDSLYHKVTLSTNYQFIESSTRLSKLPQMDRLNDDTTDQSLRDLRVFQMFINPKNAANLTGSQLFDPQNYAVRRLIENRVDTLDRIDVLQVNLEQRWQTRRGIAASEHVVDWMTLNLGASIFPQSTRDNYGHAWGILEYDWTWNIGDRTALISNGWFEPEAGGPRVFNFGGILGRPDSTNFYLGYRHIDPLLSRAVVATVNYKFSPKYAISGTTTWDFGTDTQSYAMGIVRTGTDMQVGLGLNYNSVLKTFGFHFEIVPNLLRNGQFSPGQIGAPSPFAANGR